MRTSTALRRWLCALVAAALPWSARGAGAQVSNEIWPEMDASWRPAKHQRTYFEFLWQSEREEDKREAKVGLYQDYLFLPHGFLRAGYRYVFSTHNGSHKESRIVTEGTVNGLTKGATFGARTRSEFRWVNGVYSYRIRERLRVEQETHGVKPFVSAEAFYDSRFHTIARLEGRLGAELRIHGPVSFEPYYVRQENSRTRPSDINALGLKLALAF
jgi:hypothetical protein